MLGMKFEDEQKLNMYVQLWSLDKGEQNAVFYV